MSPIDAVVQWVGRKNRQRIRAKNRRTYHSGPTGRALDLRLTDYGFKFYSRQSCVTTLGTLADPGGVGHGPPFHVSKRPECTKSRHFQTPNRKNFMERGHCPLPRPQLVFLYINHNVVSNTLVLSPRAICIHTTASFATSNGFWRLKRFKQSMEE